MSLKIKINYLDNIIELFQNNIINIEIENKKLFYRIVSDFYNVSKDEIVEDLLFMDDYDKIIYPKIFITSDFFNFNFNDKKIVNSLIKYLKNLIAEEELDRLNVQYRKFFTIYKKAINESEIPIILDEELDIDSLFKLFKVNVKSSNDLLDNLLLLIDVNAYLNISDFLIFINLKQYLNKDELNELYKYSIYKNIRIILIDSQNYGICQEYEKKLLIYYDFERIIL